MSTNNKGSDLIAASGKGDVKTVEELLGANAEVNAKGVHGDTPLIWAARNGHAEVAKKLIDAKADVNIQNESGDTPLIWAAKNGHIKVLKELISANANVDHKNHLGNTALSLLVSNKDHLKLVEELLAAKANINVQNKEGNTALIEASGEGHIKVVKRLLEAEAIDIDIQNNRKVTALIRAAANGHIETVEELIGANADIEIESEFGSASYLAFINGHHKIVELISKDRKNNDTYGNMGNMAVAASVVLALVVALSLTNKKPGRNLASSPDHEICTHHPMTESSRIPSPSHYENKICIRPTNEEFGFLFVPTGNGKMCISPELGRIPSSYEKRMCLPQENSSCF